MDQMEERQVLYDAFAYTFTWSAEILDFLMFIDFDGLDDLEVFAQDQKLEDLLQIKYMTREAETRNLRPVAANWLMRYLCIVNGLSDNEELTTDNLSVLTKANLKAFRSDDSRSSSRTPMPDNDNAHSVNVPRSATVASRPKYPESVLSVPIVHQFPWWGVRVPSRNLLFPIERPPTPFVASTQPWLVYS